MEDPSRVPKCQLHQLIDVVTRETLACKDK